MATSFDVIFLGNLATIDPTEGDSIMNTLAVDSWLGTYGGPGDALVNNIQTLATGGTGFAGGTVDAYDADNNLSNDQFIIDGTTYTNDATMVFNATLTYVDGTTASVTAVLFQTTTGNVYLAPEMSENSDQAAFEAKPIQSMTLVSPIYANGIDQGFVLSAERDPANFVTCFTTGTQIATINGGVNVENLKVGDRVFTRDNGNQTIRWIGKRRLSAAELDASPELQPIRIMPNALGPDMPEREMWLSPNHRVLLTSAYAQLYFEDNEVLAAAKHLTRLPGIDQISTDEVTYVHIMFDRHEIVLSDAIWSESFLPGEYTLDNINQEQRDEIFALFPELDRDIEAGGWTAARRILREKEARVLLTHF